MRKILITATGGHSLAALAVVEELRKKGGWEISWVGVAQEHFLPVLGMPFYTINTGKLHRRKVWQNLASLLRLPLGFLQSLWLLLRIGPHILLSFGGFVSVPIAAAAWILRVPVIVHEQTITSGLANRIVARFARRVAISSDSSRRDFPEDKVVLTGNPVRRTIFKLVKTSTKSSRVIYITGGSRGSQKINEAVFETLPELLRLGEVYHQTGMLDYGQALEKKKELGKLAAKYHVFANVSPEQAEEIYRQADLVISRAGANTVSELEVLGIPAILIPIPWVERDEQTKNAQILVERGNGVILSQDELNGSILLKQSKEMLAHPEKYKPKGPLRLAHPAAAKRLVTLIEREI